MDVSQVAGMRFRLPALVQTRLYMAVCKLFVVCTLCACTAAAARSSYILEEFSDITHLGEFNNMVIHQSTGKIYIGAVNRLYLLSETLGLIKPENTGPQEDYINCLPPFNSCHCNGATCDKPTLTQCVNKALLIDYDNQKLISCSNLFQGHCEKRSLTDLSIEEPHRYVPMIPNDRTSPVVMFIAPGPGVDTPSSPRPNVLYIAATRSLAESIYKDMVHTICSRNITTYELVNGDQFTSTRIEMDALQKQTFRIYYRYGFSSGGFSYFLTVQGKSVTETDVYVSRIVRVCQNDTRFYSYTEVPLSCVYNNTEYYIVKTAYLGYAGKALATSLGLPDLPDLRTSEDVLYVIFNNENPMTGQNSGGSVMCVYTLRYIRRVFTTTVQECFDGLGNTGPAHITKPIPCIRWKDTENILDDDYCGRYEFNHPIAGINPVRAEAVIHFPNDSITAIAVTETYDYTVAFLGTDNGQLKKVAVETGEYAFEYESFTIEDGSPVNSDMAFDRSRTHLYVMTLRKVTRVKVQDCGRYTNCSLCLAARDPYCGWCSLDNRCTLRKDCQNAEDPMRWLPYSGTQCTKIVQVVPEKIQIQENSTLLTVTVHNLPTLTNGQYQCAFRMGNGTPRFTPASLLGNPTKETANRTLQCETPMRNRLPIIPTGKDHMVMTLSVRMDGKDFVEKDIVFFNCGDHTSCSSCTDSDFPCAWCVQAHKCTYDREKCTTDTIITGKSLPGPTDSPGPEFCPRIENHMTQILVSSDTYYSVRVTALHLLDYQQNFYCRFNMDNVVEVGAIRTSNDRLDIIQCNEVQFQYKGRSSDTRAVPFQILWGRDKHPLDNPDTIQVLMYKCQAMASNCGECLTTDSRFDCGWCRDHCTTSAECPPSIDWLDRNKDCPDPVIHKFYPNRGPIQGGTLITINGENLGKAFEDTAFGITVAGIQCQSVRKFYKPAMQVVCRTGPAETERNGPIEIDIRNFFQTVSHGVYSYVEPYLMDLTPKKGPVSGGTNITITGEYMDAGTRIAVMIGSRKCRNLQLYPGMILCTTPALGEDEERDTKVIVQFDDAEVEGFTYLYLNDPIITAVSPEKGIYSGGTMIEVTGERLDIISRPQIVVYHDQQSFYGECHNVTESRMYCISPSFINSGLKPQHLKIEKPITLSYGFIMDDVESLRNLTASNPSKLFIVFPDPIFHPFDDGIRSVFQIKKHDNLLTVNGESLNLALREGDVRVTIGNALCTVISLSATVLTCKPPNFDKHRMSDKPDLYISVGSNLTFYIGQLQVETQDSILTLPIIIVIAVGAGILLIIIGIIITMYMRKSQESDRAVKRMQNQMDILEIRVAKECKEAFAELQTEMTDLTSDICGPAGIPFRDYRTFCMKVLFPNATEDEHPVTCFKSNELLKMNNPEIQKALQQFHMLIQNKLFLLIFIRTMEQDQSFTAKEKVNVASLLSCALQNRMQYHTEILKTLLADLIEKSMDSRDHPKLLLRRTNSVAEKMLTNWFTFLLYRFLKECVGEPLYMLFRAIKQQIDKGPVDAITSEARYSLSEDKLIRQQIDYKQMTIYVTDTSFPTAHEYQVRVLDCDTISQVKEKALDAIYKNAPFSSRPNKEELDLEWHTGEMARIILQDEDSTTTQEGEFRKMNTLSHYHVLDNARMALTHKQTSMYNLSMASNKSHPNSYGMTYSGSPSLSRPVSPHNIVISDIENGGAKYYHLVKHDLDFHKEGERGNKMVSEIYLTRLLATKGTLQQFVDDLLETIFSTATRRCALPLAIKYMFDFLDDQALQHCITDPEIVHTWKSNSLPLRFWINVVKNPDFVFDIHKSNIVDACLSVVAQTFMDSCSMSEHKLSKDSPSSKLLYAKDIPKYKKWVERYYQDIKQMPAISDQDMNTMLAEESRLHQNEFNLNAALYELLQYVLRYEDDLINNLQEDEFARNYHLADRLMRVTELFQSQV